ncbi:hypothetical protein BGX24_005229, partial [Mortierella sp. AD032]
SSDDDETSIATSSAPVPEPPAPPTSATTTSASGTSSVATTSSSSKISSNNTEQKRFMENEEPLASSRKKAKRSVPIRYLESPICLTSVQRVPASINVGCVTLQSLIGDPDLELMVQINFMIDVPFVMSHVHESVRDRLKTIVYHGLRLSMDELMKLNAGIASVYPRVSMHSVPVAGMGTHHTKAMILFYRDGSMQLVIHTANMIERDWRNKTQGVFRTGRLSKKSVAATSSTCAFERDLLEYLDRYFDHQQITSRIREYDFSKIKAVLIPSAPGKYSGADRNKWGHLKLRAVLRQQVEVPREFISGSKIICQMSSIGSLGKDSQDWLRGEFEASLNSYRNSKNFGQADLCVVYPTAENVRTSANLSKPAWGEMRNGGVLDVKSYELGVLIFPGLFEDCGASGEIMHVSMMNSTTLDPYPEPYTLQLDDLDPDANADNDSNNGDNNTNDNTSRHTIGVVPIQLPYDLPLKKYNFGTDHVWLVDKYFPGQDDFGASLSM